MNEFVNNAKQEIIEVQALPQKWSGEDSKKVTPEAVKSSNNIIDSIAKYLDEDIDVFPMQDGAINLSWIQSDHEIDIKCRSTGAVDISILDMDSGSRDLSEFDIESAHMAPNMFKQKLKEL